MQPYITESNQRDRDSSALPSVGVALETHDEIRYILPAVVTWLGNQAVDAAGSEKLTLAENSPRERRIAECLAAVAMAESSALTSSTNVAETPFYITEDEASAAEKILTLIDRGASDDVNVMRFRLGFELGTCRAVIFRRLYAGDIQPSNGESEAAIASPPPVSVSEVSVLSPQSNPEVSYLSVSDFAESA